ncbi:hypothetical protein, partial [Coralloluteibacterium stylophorae]|uniref:hypothetical protein n=1 Tax=Coralloluteibacterium stylophorae TaxID=1776034 RepID=UPI00360EA794
MTKSDPIFVLSRDGVIRSKGKRQVKGEIRGQGKGVGQRGPVHFFLPLKALTAATPGGDLAMPKSLPAPMITHLALRPMPHGPPSSLRSS